EDGAAYLNRGACYLFLGDTTKALDNYNMAIKLDRYDAESYVRRARIYALREQYDDAIDDLNTAIQLDSTNTLAYFNRGLMKYDSKDIQGALNDLDKVLRDDPGNALTLYNRALIYSQIGDFEKALDDYDRVININSENVLAYFNRASVFLEMRRYENAINDYSKAIELYPDFAKAYMNRAYARNMLGQWAASERDYEIARAKIREYQQNTSTKEGYEAFADTTQSYSHLIDFDADFAKKNFDNELLQYRDVDIGLKPLYRFAAAGEAVITDLTALSHKLQYEKLDAFYAEVPVDMTLTADKENVADNIPAKLASVNHEVLTGKTVGNLFAKALLETGQSQFNTAMACYNEAVGKEPDNEFLYINRGVLQADMTDFISSMDNNIRVLSLDNSASTRVTVSDNSTVRTYDYSAAISDFMKAAEVAPEFPYTYYNLGNLFCLSEDMLTAINQYTKAIDLYPYIPEAYYNRGLVLIYLKDKEKGCLDMSKAGELGIADAYSVIKKYCTEQQQ
ncbi:MAG: tetratricopeptide repeat protein, partial [Bacteroidales bacterium]|nr:tetratricopeptide repeat protein [Bacteroidales bacterium]